MKILARSALVTILVTQLTVVSARGQEAGERYCVPSLPAYNVDTFPEFDYETECAKCRPPSASDKQRVAVINSCIDEEAGQKQISQNLWDSCPTEGRRAAIARLEQVFSIQRRPTERGPYGSFASPPRFMPFYTVLADSLQACAEKGRLYNKRPGVDY